MGDVEDYVSARGEAASFLGAAEGVRDQFKRIETTGVLELQGRAAGELGEVIRGVDGCLCDLPVVMGDVEAVFGAHARELEVLKQRANEALARAEARWGRLQSAVREEHAADSRLRFLRSQQRSLGSLGVSDEHAAAESARLASAISRQSARVSYRRRSTADARDELGLSRSEHGRLQEDEQALVNHTVAALGGIDLRSLKNPGWLQKVAGWLIDAPTGHLHLRASWWLGNAIADGVAGWFGDGFSDLKKMVGALRDGDFNAALWYLQDVLDKVTLAAAVAGLVAILVASGGTATPVMIFFGALIVGSEAASAWYLWANQAPHPETGERMTLTHAILDTIGVVAGAATFGGSRLFTSPDRSRELVSGRGVCIFV